MLLQALSGEVRVTVRVDNRAEVVVALEGRDSEGQWGATAQPTDAIVEQREGEDGWWRSSVVTVEVQQAVLIWVEDGVFATEPPVVGYADDCGILFVAPREEAEALSVSTVTGAACDRWSAPLDLTPPAELVGLTARIAARWSGDCVDLRIEVGEGPGGRRSTPMSRVCGLAERVRAAAADGEGFVPQAAAPVILPVLREGGAIELRMGGDYRMNAAVGGRILPTDCGVQLERGFRSVWQHRYEGEACGWASLDRILELDDGPVPEDVLDEQQYEVYDWEYDVTSNLLGSGWTRSITFERAQEIVDAIYADFYGASDGAPRVMIAPEDQQFTGAYDSGRHVILLTPSGVRPYVVIHEAAHAMLRLSLAAANAYYLESRHGPVFGALMIALWTRYAEGFDPEAARAFAGVYGVKLDHLFPIEPSGDEQTRRAVREALGVAELGGRGE